MQVITMAQFLAALESPGDFDSLTPEDVERIQADPAVSLTLAIAAAAGAQNRIEAGRVGDACAVQEQSRLWLSIHERVTYAVDRSKWAPSVPEDGNALPRPAEDATVAAMGDAG